VNTPWLNPTTSVFTYMAGYRSAVLTLTENATPKGYRLEEGVRVGAQQVAYNLSPCGTPI
jgi:hypothetical protein